MTSISPNSVTVTSRHTLLSANAKSWKALNEPIRLGPLDQLVYPVVPIQVVFVYEQPASAPNMHLIPVECLERALALLLDYYPQLTGRLRIDPTDGTPEITRVGTGAELLVARCSERLDAFTSPQHGRILMPNLPGAGTALLAPFEGTPEGVCRDPLFAVQHTRFACGGVALGVRILHKACDAVGFFQLMYHLAELYHGIRTFEINGEPALGVVSLAHPPHIRSYMSDLSMTPAERAAALDFEPALLRVQPSVGVATAALFSPDVASTVVGRFLRFSSHELAALKAQATDPDPSSESWVSTFEALVAHLWQVVYRARVQLHANDPCQGEMAPSNYLTPVNIRPRLGEDCLPPGYFGNTLILTYATFPDDLLANGPLWQVAKALHDLNYTPDTTSKEKMLQTLRWISAQPEKGKIRESFEYGNGSFMVSQWNKFDLYGGTAFDVRPVLVQPPFTPSSLMDGMVYLLPTEKQGTSGDAGAIDVSLSLYDALWRIIDDDEELPIGGSRIE